MATKVVEQLEINQSPFEHTTAMIVAHMRNDSRAFNTSLKETSRNVAWRYRH